eukprot:m.343734 g.343734  ORF g.343734 m.343734 type:complete len:471 (-) comp23237_c0_seq1:24-1436(-)
MSLEATVKDLLHGTSFEVQNKACEALIKIARTSTDHEALSQHSDKITARCCECIWHCLDLPGDDRKEGKTITHSLRELYYNCLRICGIMVNIRQLVAALSPSFQRDICSCYTTVLSRSDVCATSLVLWGMHSALFSADVIRPFVGPAIRSVDRILTLADDDFRPVNLRDGLGTISRLFELVPKDMSFECMQWLPIVISHLENKSEEIRDTLLRILEGLADLWDKDIESFGDLSFQATSLIANNEGNNSGLFAKLDTLFQEAKSAESESQTRHAVCIWGALLRISRVYLRGYGRQSASLLNKFLRTASGHMFARHGTNKLYFQSFKAWGILVDVLCKDRVVPANIIEILLKPLLKKRSFEYSFPVRCQRYKAWWRLVHRIAKIDMEMQSLEENFQEDGIGQNEEVVAAQVQVFEELVGNAEAMRMSPAAQLAMYSDKLLGIEKQSFRDSHSLIVEEIKALKRGLSSAETLS